MNRQINRIIFAFVLALFSLSHFAAAATITVKVGYPQLSGGSMPLWVITDNKLDQRYGVDVKTIYIAGGATLTHSLVAGDIDIALTGGAVVGAVLSGADLVYAGIGLSTYGFTVYAKPEIKDINDLRGKVFGVITRGASSDHAAIALFNRYGMKAGQDVKFLYFARQGDLLASLDKGVNEGSMRRWGKAIPPSAPGERARSCEQSASLPAWQRSTSVLSKQQTAKP